MALSKDTLKQTLSDLMDGLDPANKNVASDWQNDWATALDTYIKSGTPTPASPSFSNTTGNKEVFKFTVDGIQSATNIANSVSAYIGSLTTPVGAISASNNAVATKGTLASSIIATTSNDPYTLIVNAIDSWVKSVVWTIVTANGSTTAKLV